MAEISYNDTIMLWNPEIEIHKFGITEKPFEQEEYLTPQTFHLAFIFDPRPDTAVALGNLCSAFMQPPNKNSVTRFAFIICPPIDDLHAP
jgi:hypothetical protein